MRQNPGGHHSQAARLGRYTGGTKHISVVYKLHETEETEENAQVRRKRERERVLEMSMEDHGKILAGQSEERVGRLNPGPGFNQQNPERQSEGSNGDQGTCQDSGRTLPNRCGRPSGLSALPY